MKIKKNKIFKIIKGVLFNDFYFAVNQDNLFKTSEKELLSLGYDKTLINNYKEYILIDYILKKVYKKNKQFMQDMAYDFFINEKEDKSKKRKMSKLFINYLEYMNKNGLIVEHFRGLY